MKKIILLLLVIVLVFICGACGKSQDPAPTSSPSPGLPAGPDPRETGDTQQEDAPPAQDTAKSSNLYDPSIFVIQASGTWRQELAEGYYADYECELYLDKVDSSDNRVSDGRYHGFFWMKMSLDTGEFLQDLLKDVPAQVELNAGGEGICDNLIFHLSTRDIWERDSYAIPLEEDKTLQPEKDVPADRGSFIAVAKDAYLDARASGAQGEHLEYQNKQGADVELNYIVHMQPDSMETGAQRKVTIYLNDGQGMSTTLEGVMRRLPGYPDDVATYTREAPYQEALNKHLE